MTRYQVWFNYRMSTGQLNMYYQGRELDNTCKADPSCKDLKETIAHIAWECSHAQAIWQQVWIHWKGGENHYDQQNVRQYVTSRQTPPPSQQLIQRVQLMYGFYTDDHAKALDSIWWIGTSVVTSLLWLRRNERVFWHQHSTTSECVLHIWGEIVRQCKAVALVHRSKPELKIEGICYLQVLSVFKQPRQREPSLTRQTRSLRVHFDGGSRGNPGIGGSGWCVSLCNSTTNEWTLVQGRYTYHEPRVTNDYCEINTLRLGLAAAKCSDDPGDSVIEVIGDSQLLINHFTGSAVTRNPNLAVEITEINRIIRGFNGIHWQHVKRNFNKTDDSLANIAIDAKSSGRLVRNANQLLAQRRDQVLKLLALDHTYYNRPRKPVLLGRLVDFRES